MKRGPEWSSREFERKKETNKTTTKEPTKHRSVGLSCISCFWAPSGPVVFPLSEVRVELFAQRRYICKSVQRAFWRREQGILNPFSRSPASYVGCPELSLRALKNGPIPGQCVCLDSTRSVLGWLPAPTWECRLSILEFIQSWTAGTLLPMPPLSCFYIQFGGHLVERFPPQLLNKGQMCYFSEAVWVWKCHSALISFDLDVILG